MDVLLLNGPNLNLLGTRDPATYGTATLTEVERDAQALATELGLTLVCHQDNHEGGLVDRIHAAASEGCRYIVLNAGAYTHTSIAVRDALDAVGIPFAEVHISNVYAREEFRQRSYLSAIADGVIVGCGVHGYALALRLAAHRLRAGAAPSATRTSTSH